MRFPVLGLAFFLALAPAAAQQPSAPIGPIGSGSGGTASSPPTGAAGGDLSGTYPNPSIASIGGKAVTLGGALTFSGAFTFTGTIGANTNVTFPAAGTLATLAGTEALTNKTYNGNAITAGTGTLTLAAGKTATHSATTTFAGVDGKTITFNNSLTFSGTDSSSVAFGAGGTVGAVGYATTGQLPGTATNDNASAGSVGEIFVSEVLVGSAVPLTTGTAANVTSISLTAGDWDVTGNVATSANGATVTSVVVAWTSATSATLPTSPNKGGEVSFPVPATAGQNVILPAGTQRFSLSGTTTIYLSVLANFSTNTLAAYGYVRARRVR